MPNFDLKNSGVEADKRVGRVECNRVAGASENGRVQEEREWSVGIIDRGGCVEGVSMSFVRAMSSGARIIPATPAAETATAKDRKGEEEDTISRPPDFERVGEI